MGIMLKTLLFSRKRKYFNGFWESPDLVDPDLEGKKTRVFFFPFKTVVSVKIAKSCTIMSDTLMLKKWRKQLIEEIRSPRIITFCGRSV